MCDNDINVIPMTMEHIDKVTEIEDLSFSTPWSRELLAGELKNDRARYFVAECSGEIIGYIGVLDICGEGNITNIAVHPDFRRQGVGEKLLKTVVDYADGNLDFLTLEVRESNAAAIALYEKYGFRPVGKRKNYYHNPDEDGLIMTRI